MRSAILALSLAATGCLQTDPSVNGGTLPGKPEIQDGNLLAGATSTTNWPPDDAGTPRTTVTGRADTALLLRFHWLEKRPSLSGRIRLFRSGPIPALDSVPELGFPFDAADSLLIAPGQLRAFLGNDTGLARLSLRIESDSGNCYFFGFEYSRDELRFVQSPFSVLATSSAVMYPDSSYLNGVLDSTLRKSAPGPDGKSGLYFYIPGTPHFWKAGPDSSIGLGPLPKGKYPVRILRISNSEKAQGTNRLETFEAKFTEIGNDPATRLPIFSVSAGNMLDSADFRGTLVLRAP